MSDVKLPNAQADILQTDLQGRGTNKPNAAYYNFFRGLKKVIDAGTLSQADAAAAIALLATKLGAADGDPENAVPVVDTIFQGLDPVVMEGDLRTGRVYARLQDSFVASVNRSAAVSQPVIFDPEPGEPSWPGPKGDKGDKGDPGQDAIAFLDLDPGEAWPQSGGGAAGATTSADISDFTEAAQDAVGAMVDATLTYTDGTPALGVATAYNPVGVHDIPICAGSMFPSYTGGCSSLQHTATSANHPDSLTLDFDGATEEYAQFYHTMPKGWNEGTITAKFKFSHASGSGDVIWGLQAVAISHGDALDVAFGTAQEVTTTSSGAGNLNVTAATSAITIAGTPAAGDLVRFRVYRKAAAAGDTLDGIDASLHEIVLQITTDAATDA